MHHILYSLDSIVSVGYSIELSNASFLDHTVNQLTFALSPVEARWTLTDAGVRRIRTAVLTDQIRTALCREYRAQRYMYVSVTLG